MKRIELGDRVTFWDRGRQLKGTVVLVIPCPLGYAHYDMRVRANGKAYTRPVKELTLLPR